MHADRVDDARLTLLAKVANAQRLVEDHRTKYSVRSRTNFRGTCTAAVVLRPTGTTGTD